MSHPDKPVPSAPEGGEDYAGFNVCDDCAGLGAELVCGDTGRCAKAPPAEGGETPVWAKLQAMAHNYRDGHQWDHLDGEACEEAARQLTASDALIRELIKSGESLLADMTERAKAWADYNDKPVELPVGNGVLHEFRSALSSAQAQRGGQS